MMTELCQFLKNWFDKGQNKVYGTFTIADNAIEGVEPLTDQYIRIIGSVLNDGVYKYPFDSLTDETFTGAVWYMAVPKEVEQLAGDIAAWREKNEAVDSAAMSPFNSESFGGYTYSKGNSGNSSNSNGEGTTWQSAFAARLRLWRKL